MERVELIVTGEYVVVDPARPWIENGAIAVNHGRIVSVGKSGGIMGRFEAERVLSRPHGLIIPGLINAHTHASMVLFRGLADDLPLKTWLEDHIFPAEAHLTPQLVSLGAELACAEMIRSGTTGFVDMYLFEDQVASVVDRVGLRGWLGEGVFDFPSPAFASGEEALSETQRLFDKWRGHERVTITVDPHTPYTCAPGLLKRCLEVSRRNDMMMVIHLAETDWENGEIKRRYGASPVRHLENLGLLGDWLLATHCVSVGHRDISILARHDVRIAHCPESNMKLGSGIAPVPAFIEEGITVCLGTDGAASNNDLDLLGEMDTAAKLPKGINRDPTLLSSVEALQMSTSWAAEALHRSSDLGTLEEGKYADFAVIDLDKVHLRPCYNPVSQVVYAAGAGDVQDVAVAGRLLMEDGRLVTIDEKGLMERLSKETVYFKGRVK